MIPVYIPFYTKNTISYDFLHSTIKSLDVYGCFKKIHIFYCQKEIETALENFIKRINIHGTVSCIYIEEKNPLYLPIDVFHSIQNDRLLNDNEVFLYTENDHVFHIDPQFINMIDEYIQRGYVIMPHRLGKTKGNPKAIYKTFNEFFIGNFLEECIEDFDTTFYKMKEFKESGYKGHCAYAGCYFASKKIIGDIRLQKYYGIKEICMKFFSLLHARKYIGTYIKWGIPYGLYLEAPSLILSYTGKTVLKPKNIEKLYVIHLSNNGYV